MLIVQKGVKILGNRLKEKVSLFKINDKKTNFQKNMVRHFEGSCYGKST